MTGDRPTETTTAISTDRRLTGDPDVAREPLAARPGGVTLDEDVVRRTADGYPEWYGPEASR